MMISLIEEDTLLVIKLVSKIREKFGKEIKVSTLIKNPTLEGIACLIRDKHDMTKSVAALVPLQESEKALSSVFIRLWGMYSVIFN